MSVDHTGEDAVVAGAASCLEFADALRLSLHQWADDALAVAERSVAVARASLVVAQREEDDTVVRAPFAGVVTVNVPDK